MSGSLKLLSASAFLFVLLTGCGGSSSDDEASGGNTTTPSPPPPPVVDAPVCAPGGDPVELTGGVEESAEKTYAVFPVDVRPGTTRVEIGYGWGDRQPLGGTPLTQTVFDLGIYDADGYRSAAGFRGWSGSRQGKLHEGQDPVFIQADRADRGYAPGPIEAGVWYIELGFAAVAPGGADWTLRINCLNPVTGATPAADPVDANHVARAGPAWFHGDFHMHGFHSQPNAPEWPELVQQARDAQLDFLMFTEYVTGRHWNELGAVQRANPDLLIWPGREIITYFGHVNTHGETPGVFEYRHGFEDVNLGDIQRASKDAGALFQVNHPTTFPGPLFENFCRGCEFRLGSVIDWTLVDTIEVANGPTLVNCSDLSGDCPLPGDVQIQNPFLATASLLWNDLLQQGYKIAPVSGCDSKGVDAPGARARKGYGCSATAVYAEDLSRAALTEAIKAGHLYIRARGVAGSPALEMTVTTTDGQTGTFGDTLNAEQATMAVTVRGGANQILRVLANDLPLLHLPITGDPFTHTQPIARVPLMESPLGTTWRVETLDAQSLTTIGNPVFLKP